MTTPTLPQFRAAAAVLRKAGHIEVADHLRERGKALAAFQQFMRQPIHEGMKALATGPSLKDQVEHIHLSEPPGGWQGGERP